MIKIQSDACQSRHSLGQNINSSAKEEEPLTSKCQASSVFDDDSPEEARQGKPFHVEKRTVVFSLST
jgi:hypothetical protein